MKKKFIIALLIATVSATFFACANSGSNESKEESAASEKPAVSVSDEPSYKPTDYVTLGDYLGVEVELSDKYSTDDEAFDAYVDEQLAAATEYTKDPDSKVVREDSIVNLDYQGIKDGEPFDGGTAEDQTIDVAGNCAVGGAGYIDGFTSGLVGAKVGETIDCDVKFPDDYGNADLAGQKVIFRFTINYICKSAMTRDELTDAFVKKNLDADSVEDYLKKTRETFEEEMHTMESQAIENAVLDKVVENATISGYPEDVVEDRLDYHIKSLEAMAGDTGVEEYIVTNYGMDLDTYKEQMTDRIKESMKLEMVLTAIADAEGLDGTGEGFESYVKERMDSYGVEDKETFYKNYGDTAAEGEEYVRGIYRCQQAMELCKEKAVVK